MSGIGFGQAGHEKFASPGHWNDPDMLVVGKVGWGPNLHPTKLSADEQYTHISLWCLLSAPLLIGCDMTQLDEFTLSLLTNDEVLAVDQDPLGKQAGRVAEDSEKLTQVWAKEMEDGSRAIGLFNLDEEPQQVTLRFADLNLRGQQQVRDLWRQKNLGNFSGEYTADVPAHGVVLLKVRGK
jgi:alpha-galactosidase